MKGLRDKEEVVARGKTVLVFLFSFFFQIINRCCVVMAGFDRVLERSLRPCHRPVIMKSEVVKAEGEDRELAFGFPKKAKIIERERSNSPEVDSTANPSHPRPTN